MSGRVAAALAGAGLFLAGSVVPLLAGGWCDGGCQPSPPPALLPPPPVPYVYDDRPAPRWSSSGWSYRPIYPGPGPQPPGPAYYAQPVYGPAYVPSCGDAFLPWIFGCDRRW
jgi:hypothetical protein